MCFSFCVTFVCWSLHPLKTNHYQSAMVKNTIASWRHHVRVSMMMAISSAKLSDAKEILKTPNSRISTPICNLSVEVYNFSSIIHEHKLEKNWPDKIIKQCFCFWNPCEVLRPALSFGELGYFTLVLLRLHVLQLYDCIKSVIATTYTCG